MDAGQQILYLHLDILLLLRCQLKLGGCQSGEKLGSRSFDLDLHHQRSGLAIVPLAGVFGGIWFGGIVADREGKAAVIILIEAVFKTRCENNRIDIDCLGGGGITGWIALPAWGCHPMPPRPGDTAVWIRDHEQAVFADGAGAINHQSAGGVIEAQQIELGTGRGIEHIRQGELQGCAEHRRAGRLDGEVESVLQQPRRQHVAHQLRRHRGDAHLGVVEHLAVLADHRAGLDHQLNELTLLLAEVGGPLRWGGDGGWLIWGDGGQHLGADARQVHLLPAEVFQLLCRAAHRAHDRVHLGGTDRDIHHHLRVEHIGGGIGGCSAINRHLHHTHGHIFEFKASLRIGEHRTVFQAKNEHLYPRQGL